MIEHGALADIVRQRYAGWDSPAAQALLAPGATLADVADAALLAGVDPQPRSGQQELLENLVSQFT
jgi:xylose isomerase